ncbi:MAG: 1-acyl-sn-glycerol-3-phosphate acyltransferase [Planctomycetes bacterium]|nr:1-acyl-sn-glycerol-3-phosphate acyltransferase [Planctomycetota bacterium]
MTDDREGLPRESSSPKGAPSEAPTHDPVHDGEKWYHHILYWLIVNSLRCAARVFFFAKYTNRDRVPKAGPFVLVANHVSFFDPPAAGIATPRKIHYLARASLFENRFFGGLIAALGSHPIERGASDRRGLLLAAEILEAGNPIIVFPEGHRSRDGTFQPFQRGFLLLVKKAQVPVLPIWIEGTRKILPPGRKFPRWARLRVFFGQPIPWEEAVSIGAEGIRERVGQLAPANTAQTGVPQRAAAR